MPVKNLFVDVVLILGFPRRMYIYPRLVWTQEWMFVFVEINYHASPGFSLYCVNDVINYLLNKVEGLLVLDDLPQFWDQGLIDHPS